MQFPSHIQYDIHVELCTAFLQGMSVTCGLKLYSNGLNECTVFYFRVSKSIGNLAPLDVLVDLLQIGSDSRGNGHTGRLRPTRRLSSRGKTCVFYHHVVSHGLKKADSDLGQCKAQMMRLLSSSVGD